MASLDDIFLNAREISDPAARSAYLDNACGSDTDLRRRIDVMLHDAEAADRFFGPKGTFVIAPSDVPITEVPGAVIGRYKLLQKIGEGGMGIVYMAEQREPVTRKVALKIIRLGMDTEAVVARFEAERQALALMDHPNIAKVFDGGATATGRPYFVMELVQGMSITQFCDDANLSMADRLELFLDVCSAVQHAHQKGIIHRDLKPSNILVTLHGDKSVPKVIDFGVAKATQDRLTEKTVFTEFQQFIGTPAYTSPEQASLSGLDVDTRSDIYALGVLLYELVTGKTPFDGRELLKAGLDEMRRTIREQEPPKPSTRLSSLKGDELTKTAQRRHMEPPKLVHLVRGDLDWIVMKCLEKDRGRRYETANGLAMDLKRHLANEPVLACPPGVAYRTQKFIRRNKVMFTAGAAVVAALAIGFMISTTLFLKEKAARERAIAAEREQARLRHVAETSRLQAEANSYLDRAILLSREGNLADAEKFFRQSLAADRKGWPDSSARWERSMNGLVDVLLRSTNFLAAEALLREVVTSDIVSSVKGIGLLRVRAEFFARRGQWKDAINDAERLVQFQPTNHIHYHRLAPLLVASGDTNRYQELCREMVIRFKDTKAPLIAETMAKNCLILPSSSADLQIVSNLAHFAVTSSIKDPGDLAIIRFTEGLAEYRLGNFVSATNSIRKSLATSSDVYAHIEAYAVLAMAQYQLKQTDDAKATLALGLNLQRTQSPRLENGDLTFDWRAWIRGQALMKEATALISIPAGAP